MIALDSSARAALAARAVEARDMIRITVRDRDTGDPLTVGYWSGLGNVNLTVLDPFTGSPTSRAFIGAGSLIDISPIPRVANLTVQTVTVRLSQVSDPNELVRVYDPRQAPVEIYRGLFVPGTWSQIAPAFARFVGEVDEMDIPTAEEGGEAAITLTCASAARQLGRSNPATKSDAFQRRRSATDSFRRHSAAVGGWEIRWGNAT